MGPDSTLDGRVHSSYDRGHVRDEDFTLNCLCLDYRCDPG